jgi:D-alanyl-D-alanine carboxypeptidase/D-alanyl-D-alanine-endopeptidase (penicillin-binding protein 4)
LFTVAMALDRFGADYRIKTSLYAVTKPEPSGLLKGDLIIYGRGDPTLNSRLHHGDIAEALEPLAGVLTNLGIKHVAGDLVADATFFRGPPFGAGWAWDDLLYNYGAEISALTINDNLLQVSVIPGEILGSVCAVRLAPADDLLVISNRTVTTEKAEPRKITLTRPLNSNILYVSGHLPLGDRPYSESVPAANPAHQFAALFAQALARHQITVEGRLRTLDGSDPSAEPTDIRRLFELGSIESLPLSELAREVQKPSQNLYADLLLAHTGENARVPGESGDRTSEELGVDQLRAFLAKVGIKKTEAWFEEGSGLSRDNLATPNAIVTLLRFMTHHPCAQVFLDSLPIAAVDGTLKNRMVGTAAAKNVRAKTGSLRWANSLSGYVTTAAGERLVFSILLNRYQNTDGARSARSEIDLIPVLLAGFTGKTAE